jgi:hypothetical protein
MERHVDGEMAARERQLTLDPEARRDRAAEAGMIANGLYDRVATRVADFRAR